MCIKKWIVYDNQRWWALWLDWEKAPKYFPKASMQQNRVTVTIWWSAASLIHSSFLNSVKPWHLRSMLSKSMRHPENCNACSQHQPTDCSKSSLWRHPTACCTTNISKVERIGLPKCISPEEPGPHRVSSQGTWSKILPYLASFKWMFLVPLPLSRLPLGLSCVGWIQTQHDSNCYNTWCL